MRNDPAPRNKAVRPGDVNWLARQKVGRFLDGFDKKKYDRGYDAIKWKSNRMGRR
jgi:hypothetical protein